MTGIAVDGDDGGDDPFAEHCFSSAPPGPLHALLHFFRHFLFLTAVVAKAFGADVAFGTLNFLESIAPHKADLISIDKWTTRNWYLRIWVVLH